jgi:hypothetical protein
MKSTSARKCNFESSCTPRSFLNSICTGYRRILNFPGEVNNPSLADVQFHVVSGTSSLYSYLFGISLQQSAASAELTARKFLISSANNKYLE